MEISAHKVKELRERTGAGMMECKKALIESGGDADAAAELMRKQGLAKADKKAARVAAEGTIALARDEQSKAAAIVEINCETDFVARGDDFREFSDAVAASALANPHSAAEQLSDAKLADGTTIDARRRELIAKIGENITVRRAARLKAPTHLGAYLHGTRIGALVAVEGGDAQLAHDLAMHVAASRPRYVAVSDVPEAEVAKEREILLEQARNEGKPAEIVAKMVEGRLRKNLAEQVLLGQPFVKDPDQTVEKLLKAAAAKVVGFERFEVGAGIEKAQSDFVAEVMSQVKSSGG
ncbi:MAG: translation elongation factor Ts [Steroidobacteraceae bacterium]